MQRNVELEATIVAKYAVVSPVLDERSRRRWAATESLFIGYGGDALVSSATGLARETIRKGRREISQGQTPTDRVRRPGAGRPRLEQSQPGLLAALEALVDPLTRGDPTSPLRWTGKSRAKLAAALTQQGWRVSSTTVGRMLHQLGYRLQSPRKRQEGASHPDRNAQFEHINATADAFLAEGRPVISVDTKKKELVGNFKNGGREWQPKGTPPAVLVHDFPTDAEGKAIPYGVYDMARNEAWVSVGWDHDTPTFAVASIRHWWRQMGCGAYPDATDMRLQHNRRTNLRWDGTTTFFDRPTKRFTFRCCLIHLKNSSICHRRSRWRRFATGGARWAAAPTPTPPPCSSRPMRAGTGIGLAPGSMSFYSWPTRPD